MMPVDLAAGNVMALGIMVQGAGPVEAADKLPLAYIWL